MKILIGYDGSESADTALLDLQRAGLPDEAQALIVSVADIMMVPATPDLEFVGQAITSRRVSAGLVNAQRQTARVINEARDFATRARDQVKALFPHWNVTAETLAGSPAFELINRANDWKPDLVVVGSHGHSLVGRFILGSVSKKIVTDSDHSVRVSRDNVERDPNKPPRLVIGVDGSTEAEQAIRAVGGRAWPYGTEVRIVAVDDGRSSLVTGHDGGLPLTTGRMVRWAEDALTVIGLKVSVVMEKGDPRRVLIDQAKAWDADSIFVGGRGFSSVLERFQLGSIANALVTKAHCSVEIARQPSSNEVNWG